MTSTLGHTRSTRDGTELAYDDRGRPGRDALVLLHSLGADGRMWDACVDLLQQEHRVIVPDTRGHGASGPTTETSADLWVHDLHDVLQAAGADRVVLVGVSLGGIQALTYAAAHPETVVGIVVADSFAALPPDIADAKIANLVDQARQQPMALVADQYVADTFEEPYPPGAEQVRRALAAIDSDSYAAAVEACFGARIEDRLAHVTSPALVLWGDRDAKTPRPLSERIVAGLPDARLAVVPDAGHLSNVDNPEGFVALVAAFEAELTARPGLARPEGGH